MRSKECQQACGAGGCQQKCGTTSCGTACDVCDIIKQENRQVASMVRSIESTLNMDEKQRLMHDLIRAMSVRIFCEEEAVYPMYKTKLPNGEEKWKQSIDEHQKVKQLLYDLDNMKCTDEKFHYKFAELKANVCHHAKEEESFLQMLQMHTTAQERQDMAKRFEEKRASAPLRPHPMAPVGPPMSTAAAAVTRPIDQAVERSRGHSTETAKAP